MISEFPAVKDNGKKESALEYGIPLIGPVIFVGAVVITAVFIGVLVNCLLNGLYILAVVGTIMGVLVGSFFYGLRCPEKKSP